jgi:hypothetical protein
MTSIAPQTSDRKIIVGVDTHKYAHVAVALDSLGVRLGEQHISANREGYARLEAWAASLGKVRAFGVEGTGSYGVGLASYLRRTGHRIVEVNRGDRRSRRNNGKTDTLDAEAAARAVLSGTAVAVPKSADGTVEMIRQLKIARDTARKGRTSAIVTLKALLVTAPAELREQFDGLTDKVLLDRCASLRPGAITSPVASAKHSRELSPDDTSRSVRRSPGTTPFSTTSPAVTPRLCARGSGSAPTPLPKSSWSSATIPSESSPKPPSPSCAERRPSRRLRASRIGTASREADTVRPTPPSTGQ